MTDTNVEFSVKETNGDVEEQIDERTVVKTDTAKMDSLHFGDANFDLEHVNLDANDISWNEVFRAMCCHTPRGWAENFLGLSIIFFFVYFFLVALELMGTSAKALTGCLSGSLFGDTNPVAGVVIGIIATVLLQSSSTTTSIIVSLVSAGLDTKAAIFMIMGANIGTTVTNTLVSLGQMGDGDQLERAFAGATVHDMFNCLTVLILLPVEWVTGFLYHLTGAMTPDEVPKGETWTSPFKEMTDPIVKRVILSNSKLLRDVALKKTTCEDYYPTFCNGTGAETYDNCVKEGKVGLISCDEDAGCPAFFQANADQNADQMAAGFCLFLSLVMLCIALIGLVWILQKMLMGASQRVIAKTTSVNGYISIMIGLLLTMLVQSSSVTTSTLTPLVGLGIIPLEQMFPFTLGANIGTTVTGLLAALNSGSANSLQVALAHLMFNITGTLIFWPIPFMRRIPLGFARQLGKYTRIWRGFPVVYILMVFVVIPIILLGLSYLLASDQSGAVGFGVVLVLVLVAGLARFLYYWIKQDGRAKTIAYFERRSLNHAHRKNLPENIDFLLEEVKRLKAYTGIPEAVEPAEEAAPTVEAAKPVEEDHEA